MDGNGIQILRSITTLPSTDTGAADYALTALRSVPPCRPPVFKITSLEAGAFLFLAPNLCTQDRPGG